MSESGLVSRNITVCGKRTSVRLEIQMWKGLKDIADREGCKIHDICSLIALNKKSQFTLTAAIRIFIMMYYRAAATEEGHRKAGHGCFSRMIERANGKSRQNQIDSTSFFPDYNDSRAVPVMTHSRVNANNGAGNGSANGAIHW